MKIYTGISGDGISLDARSDGTLVVEHSGVVQKGVTFSGPVTFNGAYTVVNAQEFSVDDYIIMLGATGAGSTGLSAGGPGAADSVINSVGAGVFRFLEQMDLPHSSYGERQKRVDLVQMVLLVCGGWRDQT